MGEKAYENFVVTRSETIWKNTDYVYDAYFYGNVDYSSGCRMGYSFLLGEIWRDNIAKGIPEFYRSLPEKNLFPDEKNILFYAISLFEIIIWMTATFMQESISGQKLFGKTVSYINFAMLEIIISSIYHILWVVINLKCLDNIKNIKVLNIYYSAMAIIIFILIKLGIVTKIYSNVLAPKVDMLCALCVGTIFCVGLSFLVGRKCFEKSEVK